MRLDATEFIRRFLLHVLPAGFVKIRHFGLLANRNRRRALALCRAHLRSATAVLATLLGEQQWYALNDPAPSADAEPCTSSHIISLIAAQPRRLHLSAPLSIPREETMRTQIRSQLVPAAACESAFAELRLQSPLCPKLVNPSPSSETVWLSHGIQDPIGVAAFSARSTASASGRVHPIPIHPPR